MEIRKMKRQVKPILILIGVLTLLNWLGNKFPVRWDLTADHRFTLSETSKELLSKIDENIIVKVYLKGEFPLDFKRLQQATEQHLEELKNQNKKLHYQFINPNGIEEKLLKKGLQASRLTMEENGTISETLIFPWAVISYKNKTATVPLLLNTGNSQKEQLQLSIENLEFAFSEALSKVLLNKRKSIAVLKGNGELNDIYLYDLLNTLKEKYNLAPFLLSKKNETSYSILKAIHNYDLALIAKPTQAFSEEEKLILDQYIMNGGKTLWMLDTVLAEMDSLQQNGEALFVPRELNLTDLLFSYGVRVNYNLVEDLYSSKIAIATGNRGNQTQFNQFLWRYYPLITPNDQHPITKKIEAVNLRFPTNIDTLANKIHKKVLLQSSPLTKMTGLPNLISLNAIAERVSPEQFNSKPQILGVLLEGKFVSAYTHRTKAFKTDFQKKSVSNKMIIISDGDIAANQIQNGKPTRLDVDKWTGQHFGNKDFLLNAIDYLIDDTGLINLRSKSLDIVLLNKEKIHKDKRFWQFINIVLPMLLLALFGFGFNFYLKKKYS